MTITIKPKNKAELKKIKTILEAIEVDFEESTEPYNKKFLEKIKKSKEEIKKGEIRKIPLQDLWS